VIVQLKYILQHDKYSNQRHLLLAVTTIWSFPKVGMLLSLEILLQCHR